MVLAFCVLIALAVISLVCLGDVYWMLGVENGYIIPGLDIFDRIGNALRSTGSISIL